MSDEPVRSAFQQRLHGAPTVIVRAPGRINLIGGHTDYNDGFVLPIAIDRSVWIALRPRNDRRVVLHSIEYDDILSFDVDHIKHTDQGWGEYVKGIAAELRSEGHELTGWEGVMTGDVPRGGGLSSSAAVELVTARAFAVTSGLEWNPRAMALLGQRVENEWIGVNCGIMDQMISAAGQAGHALLLDCRSLEWEMAPLPADTAVVVMDTSTRRGLVDSAYNERRRKCEEAAEFFGVHALRDVDPAVFEARGNELPELMRRRSRHVITENARTVAAAEAMRQGDVHELGNLINASHASLRDDFEVSSRELDAIVELAQQHNACYGARMTGAGFGGCAVALVSEWEADDFVPMVAGSYQRETGYEPQLYVCQAAEGAEVTWSSADADIAPKAAFPSDSKSRKI